MDYLILDCDGCLTDGKKIVNSAGNRVLINFNSKDNIAMKQFIEVGVKVVVISASGFDGIKNYWEKYGATVILRAEDKLETLITHGFDVTRKACMGVGDDLADVGFLNCCTFAVVPKDAHPLLLKQFDKLKCKGGEGVVAHLWHFYKETYNYQDGLSNRASVA